MQTMCFLYAVREFANKSAASAASPDYVKFQAVIKSAANAASLRGGRASGRLDHGMFFSYFLAALAAKKSSKDRTLTREEPRFRCSEIFNTDEGP